LTKTRLTYFRLMIPLDTHAHTYTHRLPYSMRKTALDPSRASPNAPSRAYVRSKPRVQEECTPAKQPPALPIYYLYYVCTVYQKSHEPAYPGAARTPRIHTQVGTYLHTCALPPTQHVHSRSPTFEPRTPFLSWPTQGGAFGWNAATRPVLSRNANCERAICVLGTIFVVGWQLGETAVVQSADCIFFFYFASGCWSTSLGAWGAFLRLHSLLLLLFCPRRCP